MSWLHAPIYLLQALAAQIPTLLAGEALQHAAEVTVGTGSMKKPDLDRTLRDWQRVAGGQTAKSANWEEFAASVGIELVKEPR